MFLQLGAGSVQGFPRRQQIGVELALAAPESGGSDQSRTELEFFAILLNPLLEPQPSA